MEKAKQIFAGSGKKQNDTWLKVNLNFTELEKYAEEYMGKKYVKVNINIGKPDKFQKDVQVTIDTWKPTTPQNSAPANKQLVADDLNDLPF